MNPLKPGVPAHIKDDVYNMIKRPNLELAYMRMLSRLRFTLHPNGLESGLFSLISTKSF